MRHFLLLLLSLVCSTHSLRAQKRDDGKVPAKETAAASNKTASAATVPQNGDIPDKWKNESAVILDQTLTYAYYNSSAFFSGQVSNVVKETISRRIKLLDKAAVKDFSEFYFYESESDALKRERGEKKGIDESRVKIVVVKSTGERVKVNISDAIEVKDDVPRFYRSYYMGNKKYKKIAIPNLNVGDVMDYQLSVDYEVSLNLSRSSTSYHAFPAFNNTLSTKYAVMRQEYNFMLESGFCLNMNTYNGAPGYELLRYGYDFKGKKTDKMRTFQIIDTDRDKLPEEMMSLPLTQYPSMKFQVVAKAKDDNDTEGSIFIGNKDAIKRTVEPEEVAERFIEDFNASYRAISLGLFWMKKKKIQNWRIEEKAKAIYGYIKNQYVNALAGPNAMIPETQTLLYKYERAPYGIKDFYFAVSMSRCLDDADMDYEIIAVMPRSTGKIKDLLLGAEITWIVKVANPTGQPIYLYPMTGYQTSDVNSDPYLYGAEGYSFVPSKKMRGKNKIVATKVNIPVPDPSVSTLKTKMVAAFDDQLEKLTMERTTSATGIFKANYTSYTILSYDFLDAYEKEYDDTYDEVATVRYAKREAERKKKRKSKEDIKEEEDFKFLVDKRKELMQNELKDDYDDIDTYDSFRLIKPGIIDRDSALIFNEQFKLNNLISKAGRNYTLEIGKILSKQPKLDEDNLKPRQMDIHVNYPKTIVYEVELTLPTGYTIEDLKDLNTNLDNDMMRFKVEAQLVGDKLLVKTTKVYKKITAPKAEWPKMVDVFTTAYDFSQKKVVLKKKQ